jgi:hypothetical protein
MKKRVRSLISAVALRRSYQETKALPSQVEIQGINRRAVIAPFTRTERGKVAPLSVESKTMMSSLPVPVDVAKA